MLKIARRSFVATWVALVTAGAIPAQAETVTVSKMTYSNNGAYNANFLVRYNLDDGTNCTVRAPRASFTGTNASYDTKKKVNVDLTAMDFDVSSSPGRCLIDGAIPDGIRVWGKVEISAGDNVSCKKSIVLVKGSGGATMNYHTGGTTFNDNRCKQSLDR